MIRAATLSLAALLCTACGGDNDRAKPEPMLDRGPDPFVFSTEPEDAYARVDRTGAPAVATVLLPASERDRFNQDDPVNDGDYSGFVVPTLERLHFELDDDLAALDLAPCPVDSCVRQAVPMVVPDVLRLTLALPDGFPNGRRLEDSVVDRIVAVALLDVATPGDCMDAPCTIDSLVNIPVNPAANELAFLPDFPYLAPPHP